MDKRVNSPRGLCSKVKTLTSLEDNHMTTASCWQQLQIGYSLIKDSFYMVVYFVRNSLLLEVNYSGASSQEGEGTDVVGIKHQVTSQVVNSQVTFF